MSTYEPGTVAVATVLGVPNVRVMRMAQVRDDHVYLWSSAQVVANSSMFRDDHVTDVRPLVVLDLHPEQAAEATRLLRASGPTFLFLRIADQIEAQTKPPRIPEPGLWGIVEAGVKQHSERLQWVRLGDNYRPNDEDEYDRAWSDLIDPILIRDGIEAAS